MNALLRSPDVGAPVPATSRTIRGQLDMTFDVAPVHLGTVRRVVREHLRWWGVGDEAIDRVVLALHELLTNVLEHTEPDQRGHRMTNLLIQQVPGGLSAVVRDRDRRPPVRLPTNPTDESGRGLTLVHAVTDDSDVAVTTIGKDVWVFVGDGPADTKPRLSRGSPREEKAPRRGDT